MDERDALLKTHRELELCYAALAKQPRGFLSSAEAFVCLGFVRKCFLQNREQRLRFPLVVPLCLRDNEAGRGQAHCVGNHVTNYFPDLVRCAHYWGSPATSWSATLFSQDFTSQLKVVFKQNVLIMNFLM